MPPREPVQDLRLPRAVSPVSRPRDPFVTPSAPAPTIEGSPDISRSIAAATQAIEGILSDRIQANREADILKAKSLAVDETFQDEVEAALQALGADRSPKQVRRAVERLLEKRGVASPTAKTHLFDAVGRQSAGAATADIRRDAAAGLYASPDGTGEERLAADLSRALAEGLPEAYRGSGIAQSAFQLEFSIISRGITEDVAVAEQKLVRAQQLDLAKSDLVLGTATTPGYRRLGVAPAEDLPRVHAGIRDLTERYAKDFLEDIPGVHALAVISTYNGYQDVEEKRAFVARLHEVKTGEGYAFDPALGRVPDSMRRALETLEARLESDIAADQDLAVKALERAEKVAFPTLLAAAKAAADDAGPLGADDAAYDAVVAKWLELAGDGTFGGVDPDLAVSWIEQATTAGVTSSLETTDRLTRATERASINTAAALLQAGERADAEGILSNVTTPEERARADALLADTFGAQAVRQNPKAQILEERANEVRKLVEEYGGTEIADEVLDDLQSTLDGVALNDTLDKAEAARLITGAFGDLSGRLKAARQELEARRAQIEENKTLALTGTPEERRAAVATLRGLRAPGIESVIAVQTQQESSRTQAALVVEQDFVRAVSEVLRASDEFSQIADTAEGVSIRQDLERQALDVARSVVAESGRTSPGGIIALRTAATDSIRPLVLERYADAGTTSAEAEAQNRFDASRRAVGAYLLNGDSSTIAAAAKERITRTLPQGVDVSSVFTEDLLRLRNEALAGDLSAVDEGRRNLGNLLGGKLLTGDPAIDPATVTTAALSGFLDPSLKSVTVPLGEVSSTTGASRTPLVEALKNANLLRPDPNLENAWQVVRRLETAGPFHREFPLADGRRVIVDSIPGRVDVVTRGSVAPKIRVSISTPVPDDLTIGPAALIPPSIDIGSTPVARLRRLLIPEGVTASDEEVRALARQSQRRTEKYLDL